MAASAGVAALHLVLLCGVRVVPSSARAVSSVCVCAGVHGTFVGGCPCTAVEYLRVYKRNKFGSPYFNSKLSIAMLALV